MDDGCLAVLGFSAVGTTYYDVNVKRRWRILPFILWIDQHRKELIRRAASQPISIELGNRAFISVKAERDPDSCFIINLDENTWSESGHTPWYLDWGEVWLYSKREPHTNRDDERLIRSIIHWESLPNIEEYARRVHIEKKICHSTIYDYEDIKAIETYHKYYASEF